MIIDKRGPARSGATKLTGVRKDANTIGKKQRIPAPKPMDNFVKKTAKKKK